MTKLKKKIQLNDSKRANQPWAKMYHMSKITAYTYVLVPSNQKV